MTTMSDEDLRKRRRALKGLMARRTVRIGELRAEYLAARWELAAIEHQIRVRKADKEKE